MATPVVQINPTHPEAEPISRAAEILRAGGLVVFPTETVYGLGANALDPEAVARVFTAKGRPSSNPLIVHVLDAEQARSLVSTWPAPAQALAERFWPGPLTLVLAKNQRIPPVVTAGGSTVALRVPAHRVAQALLAACQVPLAAPSANRATRLSPTRAEHVAHDLAGRVDLILDAGATSGGLESTVLDLTTEPPRLLRPGLVTPAELEAVVGRIDKPATAVPLPGPARSPGMLGRHYAPRAPLECAGDFAARIAELRRAGIRAGGLAFRSQDAEPGTIIVMPRDPARYAARFYAALHALDELGVEQIVVELPPEGEEWLAIHDRLRRAATRA